LPLGPLPGSRYPDSRLESAKPKLSFGPNDFPAFAGTMAVERVATGFRWAEGPVYFPAGRYVLFSDIPNNRIMRFSEDDGHLSVYRQPSMNSNGNTIDREGRLITCEHSGRRVTRTEHDGSITIIADKYNGKKLNSPNDAVVAADGSIWFTDPAYGIGGFYEGIKAEPEQAKHNVFRVDPKSGEIKIVVDDFVEPMALPSRPMRRSSMSSTPASRTGRTTRRISVCSTWMLGPESCRTARSLRKCPSPPLATGCAVTRTGVSGAPWVGAIRTRTACAATPQAAICSARSIYRKLSPTGNCRQPETVANLRFGGMQRNRLYICGSTSL
jgi:gluconolactonase